MSSKSLLRGVGMVIRERRQLRSLSQEALAHQAGVHPNVVGRLERGKYNPTVLTLQAITTKLNISLDELFAAASGH